MFHLFRFLALCLCIGFARPATAMQIFVTSDFDTITLDVEPSDNVGVVKSMLQDKLGIPTDQQSLLFGGEQLNDFFPLYAFGIENNSTLYLLVRYRGLQTTEPAIAARNILAQRHLSRLTTSVADHIAARLAPTTPGPTLSSAGGEAAGLWLSVSAQPDDVGITLGAARSLPGGALTGIFAAFDRRSFATAGGPVTTHSPALGLYGALPLPGALNLHAMIGITRDRTELADAHHSETRRFAAIGLGGHWTRGALTLSPDLRLAGHHANGSRFHSVAARLRATAAPGGFPLSPYAQLVFDRSTQWSPGLRQSASSRSVELGLTAPLGGGSFTVSASRLPTGPTLKAGYALTF